MNSSLRTWFVSCQARIPFIIKSHVMILWLTTGYYYVNYSIAPQKGKKLPVNWNMNGIFIILWLWLRINSQKDCWFYSWRKTLWAYASSSTNRSRIFYFQIFWSKSFLDSLNFIEQEWDHFHFHNVILLKIWKKLSQAN